MIELIEVKKNYLRGTYQFQALKGISLSIAAGELVAIMGSSGSGKTTLMNILGLLDRPTTGEYFLNKKNVSTLSFDEHATLRNQFIGFVFQSFHLLPRMNVLQNVGLPLLYRNIDQPIINNQALLMLERVGMHHLYHHKPYELSGGQQQRVAIARALIGSPKIILADEPTGALDSKTGKDVLNLLIDLHEKEKATVIIITHDEKVARQCHRVIYIQDGLIKA